MVFAQISQTDLYSLIPFVAYLVGVFVIAVVSARYLKGRQFETEYYVGSRSFGPWVLAMSWVATMASGGSFLGYPSRVYTYGWSMALWVSGSCVAAIVGLGIVGKRINRLARQTGALTLVDLLRDRFSSRAIGVIYPIIIVLITTVYLLAQFAAGAKILENMLGIQYRTGLAIFAVTVVAYTTYGGFRAVAWTDTMQGIVMIVGIVLLVPFAVAAVPGGLTGATMKQRDRQDPVAALHDVPQERDAYLYGPGPRKIPSNIKELVANEAKPGKSKVAGDEGTLDFWLPLSMGISYFMLRSLAAMMMPTTVPRMLSFQDTRALRRAIMVLAPYMLLMYFSSMITMNCAHSLDLGLASHQADQAVPALAKKVAPAWLAGILIAAPFAAVMSTVDSALLVISASVVRDLVQKGFCPQLSQRMTKRLSYSVTAGIGLVIFVWALREPTFIQPLIIFYSGGGAAALFWPSLAALYWKRATGAGVLMGLIGGALTFVLCNQWLPFKGTLPLHPFVYGFVASGLLTWVVSLVTPRQQQRQLELYFGRDSK